jgi:hypothetical protein
MADDAEIVERVPVKSCIARGPAVDLVLDRGRENRSQLFFTRLKGGREAIFWQSARTAKKARPGVRTPTARASGLTELEIVVDTRERYGYRFASQQARTVKGALRCGDYGVRRDGDLVAVVERKSLEDLAHSLVDGRLAAQLGELDGGPRGRRGGGALFEAVHPAVRPARLGRRSSRAGAGAVDHGAGLLRRDPPWLRSGPTGSWLRLPRRGSLMDGRRSGWPPWSRQVRSRRRRRPSGRCARGRSSMG